MIAIPILCFALCSLSGVVYGTLSAKRVKTSITVFFKCLTTVIASLPAAYAFYTAHEKFMLFIFVGILCSATADGIIYFRLIPGMTVFALAHAFFIASFIIYADFSLLSIPVFVVFLLFAVLLFIKLRPKKDLTVPGIIYAAVIGVMFSSAVPLAFNSGITGVCICAAALLFTASDSMLLKTLVKGASPGWEAVCLIFYYSAEYLFGLSCFLYII